MLENGFQPGVVGQMQILLRMTDQVAQKAEKEHPNPHSKVFIVT